MEIALGEKSSPTEFFARRLAVILSGALSARQCSHYYREAKGLYDVRSMFVHNAKPASEEALLKAFHASCVTARHLIALQRHPEAAKSGFFHLWRSKLDSLWYALQAGECPSQQEVATWGLGPEVLPRLPFYSPLDDSALCDSDLDVLWSRG